MNISQQITEAIVRAIADSRAWAPIADTAPDVDNNHKEESNCVRIVKGSDLRMNSLWHVIELLMRQQKT
jgi:hypothetical protein